MALALRFDFEGDVAWRDLRDLVEARFPGRLDFRVGPSGEGHRCLVGIGGIAGRVTVELSDGGVSVWAPNAHHDWLDDVLRLADLNFVSPTRRACLSQHSFDYALGPGDPAHHVLFVGEPDGAVRFAVNVGFVAEEFGDQVRSSWDERDTPTELTDIAQLSVGLETDNDVEHLSRLLRRTIACCRRDLVGWLDARADERIFALLR